MIYEKLDQTDSATLYCLDKLSQSVHSPIMMNNDMQKVGVRY